MATNEQVEPGPPWDEELVRRVGAEAKRLRGRQSARELSDITEELGYRISPQVIARLDTGRRAGHLEVAELIVLARALGVAPIQLLYPDLPNGDVEVLPGQQTNSIKALQWFSGEDPHHGAVERFRSDVHQLLELSRQMWQAMSTLASLEDDLENSSAELQRISLTEPTGRLDEIERSTLEDRVGVLNEVLKKMHVSFNEMDIKIEELRAEQGL